MGSMYDTPDIRSYDQAARYLGSKATRPLYYATRVNRRGTAIAITHHATDIITYHPLGDVVIDTAGWHTVTTKARLNRHLPHVSGHFYRRIYQEDSIWYIIDHNGEPVVFADGMTIKRDGTITGSGPSAAALKAINKRILAYTRGYIKALFAGKVPAPGPGDCWYCYFRTGEVKRVDSAIITTGKPPEPGDHGKPTLGEVTRDDHLKSHLETRYYVPSLLARAIEVFPVSKAAKWCLAGFWGSEPDQREHFFDGVAKQQLRSSLRRFLRRGLGLAS